MMSCSKLKNGLCKIVTKSQVVTKSNVTKSRLHCMFSFFIQSMRIQSGNVKYMRPVFFFYCPLNWNKLWRATSFFFAPWPLTTEQVGWFLRRFLSFHIFKVVSVLFSKIEIKPCRLGSRIRNMEAESHNFSFLESLVSRTGPVEWSKCWVKVPKCALRYDVVGLQKPLQPQWSKMIMPMLSRKAFATNSLK